MTDGAASSVATRRLESWATTLNFLDPAVVPGVERLARRMSLLMDGRRDAAAGNLEPNGYGGLSRRGEVHRLLLSDWLLAEAEPDEFLRRVTMSELSYLEVERVEPRPPGQIAALFDSGPLQVGAPRMAQLAALVVLDRRARAAGVPLVVGHLADPVGSWTSGALPDLFDGWLRARSPHIPQSAAVEDWAATLDEPSAVWVFGLSDSELDGVDPTVEHVRIREAAWGSDGASAVSVQTATTHVELELPDPPTCVRILRGRGLRRAGSAEAGGRLVGAGAAFASFHGSTRQLICRSDRPDELLTLRIPDSGESTVWKLKRKRFDGPVLAASAIGRRVVGLVVDGHELRGQVIGKRLGGAATMSVDLSELGLALGDIEELAAGEIAPLFFQSGDLLTKLDDRWWRITRDGVREDHNIETVAAGTKPDEPRVVRLHETRRTISHRPIPSTRTGDRVVVGPASTHAVQVGSVWELSNGDRVAVDDDVDVIGLVECAGEPVLVACSPAGQLLRLHGAAGTSTLTKFSGDIARVVVHPTLPLVAIERRSDPRVDVIDVELRALVATLSGETTS